MDGDEDTDKLQSWVDEDFAEIAIPSGSEEEIPIKDVLGDGSPKRIRDAVMLCNLYDIESSEGPPEQPQACDELLGFLLDLVPNDKSGSRYTLRIALQLAQQLYAETSTSEASRRRRGYRAHRYSVALGHQYWADGDPKHLDDAIRFSEKAFACSEAAQRILRGLPVTTTVESDHDVHILNTWAARLGERFELAGSLLDLNLAINIMERLISAVRQSGWEDLHAEWLGNLSAHLHRRFEQDESGSTNDVDRAITLAEKALAICERRDDGQIVTALYALAHPLGGRASATGSTRGLDEAIAHLRRAQSITSSSQQSRNVEIGFNLAMRLQQKSQIAADSMDTREVRDEALEIAQRTLEIAPADHTLQTHLHNLIGMLIYAQFMQQRAEPEMGVDVRLALTHLWSALTSPQSLSTLARVQAGRMILDLCCTTEQWRAAYEAAVTVAALIPKLSSRAVRNQDKQRLLGNQEVVGFGADAAAAALNAGEDGYAALRLLEASRGSLASSIADLRTDLAELRGQHPDLAKQFAELRGKLQSNSLRRHRANSDFDTLLEQIRAEPNFENFLQTPSKAQMQEAALEGPIVVLTASHYRGVDAIVVEKNGIRVLQLVGITPPDLEERSGSDMDSQELLGWLWDSIAKKVLDALGLTEPMSPDEPPPRVWWVLVGMMGRFPLHAAGHHFHGSTESVMDRAASSYTTSIRALVKARRDALSLPRPLVSKALLVAVANAPACPPLQHARSEIKGVEMLLSSKGIDCIQLADAPRREGGSPPPPCSLPGLSFCGPRGGVSVGSSAQRSAAARLESRRDDGERHFQSQPDPDTAIPGLSFSVRDGTGQRPEVSG